MTIKLKANRPTIFNIWRISVYHEKLYAHKFHGKPVNNFALKKSENAIAAEKIKIEDTLYFKSGPTNKIISPVNRLRNKGININAKGIKTLKFSSNVNELVIHEIPLK